MLAAVSVSEAFQNITANRIVVGILIAVAGYVALRFIAALTGHLARRRFAQQARMLLQKLILYVGSIVLLLVVLGHMGVDLTALLGAAGIAGIAFGFASQTSLSNIISGLFLISEKPFAVGDWIQVGEMDGYVLSIDLLSVKIRKHNNEYVRIPNETLLKSDVVNISRFPVRRYDFTVGVAYKENAERVHAILMEVARSNRYTLHEPEPQIYLARFGDSAIEFTLGVWHAREDWLRVRYTILEEIKARFDADGIEIPFPHRSLYAGSATAPFPIRLVRDKDVPGEAGPAAAPGGTSS
jgi:small-conductance mechanosensitive channel